MQTSIRTAGRKLTERDYNRLSRFTARGAMAPLADILDDADILRPETMPGDVVTMYARFAVADADGGPRQLLELCYPWNADAARGRISVLSPAGMGLIGLPAGAVGRWKGPGGHELAARIEEILFQPEAAGDYLR